MHKTFFDKNFYCISSRVEKTGHLYSCFKIGPFYDHQSLTFANALRRTLLANTSRCFFDAIQIYEIEHEFSSLIGVRESIIDILLTLEKLIIQVSGPITKPQVAYANFCGPGIFRAHHIHFPPGFKCVNPSQYIATLETDGHITFKLFFSPDWGKIQPFWEQTKENRQRKGRPPASRSASVLAEARRLRLPFSPRKRSVGPKGPKAPQAPQHLRCLLSAKLSRNPASLGAAKPLKQVLVSSSSEAEAGLPGPQKLSPLLNLVAESGGILTEQKISCKFIKASIPIKNKFQFLQFQFFIKRISFFPIRPKRKKNRKNFRAKKSENFSDFKPSVFMEQKNKKTNFLFFNSSSCPIEKVNYTIQSQGTKLTKFSKNDKLSIQELKKSNFQLNCTVELKNEHPKPVKNKNIKPVQLIFEKSQSQLSETNNAEFLLFEIWTNGSIHPQTAFLNAINELLLEIFPYSLKLRKNYLSTNFQKNLFKQKKINNLTQFREKLLFLEIGNFYFDFETYLFLKKNNIYRIIDFLAFCFCNENFQTCGLLDSSLEIKSSFIKNEPSLFKEISQIKRTLRRFKTFIEFLIHEK